MYVGCTCYHVCASYHLCICVCWPEGVVLFKLALVLVAVVVQS